MAEYLRHDVYSILKDEDFDMSETKVNPLGSAPIGKFAIPSIVAMLVGALYNIVD